MSDNEWLAIDLFSGTGGFSAAFTQSRDWDVITVDNAADRDEVNPTMEADVFDLTADDFPTDDYAFVVVLAGPPCKAFSMAAAHHHLDADLTPTSDFGAMSLKLVKTTLDLINALDPDWWFVENPRAGMRRVMREASWGIGEPTGTVSYCQYGRCVMKPTDLWGEHPPMVYRFCAKGEDCHTAAPRGSHKGVDGGSTSDLDRGRVPYGLSLSILEAVERAIDERKS